MTDARGSELFETEDFLVSDGHLSDDDRTFPERPCGDPAAHDRLLMMLRRYHPEGHDTVVDGGAPMWRSGPALLETSLAGSSASLCADAA